MAAKKTYHIITIGCQMNKADSERLAGALERNGYEKIDNKEQADLVVVNTCGVRQTAEDRIYGLIPRLKKTNKKAKIVLTGCLVKRLDVKNRLKDYVDSWLPITKISNFQFPISKQIPNHNFQTNAKCENDYLKIIPKYQSKFSAFVPIGNGCNNFCSYCVVPYARGREVYRPAKEIAGEARRLVKNGYKEIILIAQNVNSYLNPPAPLSKGGYRGLDFADLLKMVNDIKGDFWIKFSTSHPKDMSDKLIKTMADCDKVCSYVHLPVQAGDDEVLAAMNRKYTRADYIKLVGKIRKVLNDQIPMTNDQANPKSQIPNSKQNFLWRQPVSITTDIIVGFPGETKKQFNNTANLMQEVKFDMAYIARYSPRPGTAAFKLADNVSRQEKKRREAELMKILRKSALENNKKYIGRTVKVLIESKNKRSELFGSTKTAKTVKILAGDFDQRLLRSLPPTGGAPRNDKLVGKFVNVKITAAKDFGLAGEIVNFYGKEK